MTDFDAQLATRLQRLAAAAPPTHLPADGVRRSRSLTKFVPVAFVAAAVLLGAVIVGPRFVSPPLATITVGTLQIRAEQGAAWSGSVDRATAEAAAMAKILSFDPTVEELSVATARQVAGVRTVSGPSGRVLEASNPVDAWVFLITGTSEEWSRTTGWAVVNARSGEIIHADLLHTNDPAVP